MRRSGELWARVGLAVALLAFLGVSQRLFSSRYWAGDVYPSYSSRSSSPRGTRALYEALAALPDREVGRSNLSLDQLARDWTPTSNTTLIVAGLPSWQLAGGGHVPEALDRLAAAGARVVLGISREERPSSRDEIFEEAGEGDEGSADESYPEPTGAPEDEAAGEPSEESRAAADRAARWAFALLDLEEELPAARRAPEAGSDLPEEIAWRSPLVLELRDEAWTTLYRVEDGPVLAERAFGESGGSVVLAAGSFFLTNAAQTEDRQVELLARVIGPAARVIFDEGHLGLVSTPGVVALGRRYRLHGVALAVIAVLGLAVWRGAGRLLPAPPAVRSHATAARGSREGMVALLHRGIAEARLLRVCVEEWSAAHPRERPSDEVLRISREADPVSGYRRLSELLEPKKRSR